VHGGIDKFSRDPFWEGLIPFYEYFHADSARDWARVIRTGWTSLIAPSLESAAKARIEAVQEVPKRDLKPRSAA